MLDAKARRALQGLTLWSGRLIARLGLSPNAITGLGLAVTGAGAWFVLTGRHVTGGLILIAGGVLDFLDGAVAKATGRTSVFGSFLDSVTDRMSDALLFSALLWFFAQAGEDRLVALTLAVFALTVLTSYIRAKAESLGFDCRVGILERAERLVLIITGLVLGILEPMLWIVTALGAVTVGQRLLHVGKQARARH